MLTRKISYLSLRSFCPFSVPYVAHIKWVVYITRAHHLRSLKENEPNTNKQQQKYLRLIHTKTEAQNKNTTEIINIWPVYAKKISIKIRERLLFLLYSLMRSRFFFCTPLPFSFVVIFVVLFYVYCALVVKYDYTREWCKVNS